MQEIPEEAKGPVFWDKYQKEEREKLVAEMENRYDALVAEATYFISDLTPDQATTLRKILKQVSNTPVFVIELQGILAGSLVYLHNRTVDGKDPDAEMKKILEEAAKPPLSAASAENLSYEELIAKHKEYNVELMSDGQTVRCSVCCIYTWPNLEDRMMKPADECPCCIQKAKWG